MSNIRFAAQGDIERQKEIWKLCFGDSDEYIDFYYLNRYKDEETVLLLHENEIVAMLTMIPVKTVFPDKRIIESVMLYAIATHPEHRGHGYASELISYVNQELISQKGSLSVLVPSDQFLFEFYREQGYRECFYIYEKTYDSSLLPALSIINGNCLNSRAVTASEYNEIRSDKLRGKLHISYNEEDIEHQKRISVKTGADIYSLEINGDQGCAVLESIDQEKLFIKELLIAENLINEAIRYFAGLFKTKEIIVRMPVGSDVNKDACDRAFGMMLDNEAVGIELSPECRGYLGLAFD